MFWSGNRSNANHDYYTDKNSPMVLYRRLWVTEVQIVPITTVAGINPTIIAERINQRIRSWQKAANQFMEQMEDNKTELNYKDLKYHLENLRNIRTQIVNKTF